jgi:hypothetical protein
MGCALACDGPRVRGVCRCDYRLVYVGTILTSSRIGGCNLSYPSQEASARSSGALLTSTESPGLLDSCESGVRSARYDFVNLVKQPRVSAQFIVLRDLRGAQNRFDLQVCTQMHGAQIALQPNDGRCELP